MGKSHKRIAIFPGTFDPITLGHLDVIQAAARLVDELIVAVGRNPAKSSLLPQSQRLATVREVVGGMPGVRVEAYAGLTADFARRRGAAMIVRGLRSQADMAGELQAAQTNLLVGGVPTVFIPAAPEHGFIASSLVRQIIQLGGDASALVPPQVLRRLKQLPKKR